ncbi:MAG: DEAD/DEAH box helicase [Crenarchaeota archaeon]|nr:DEAD/DEAH box helicase [Thermoproteota archaeon]
MCRSILDAVSRKDVEALLEVLRRSSTKLRLLPDELKRSVADFLFYSSCFDDFVRFCSYASIDDSRVKLVTGRYPILSLDIETIYVPDVEPREIGLVFISGMESIPLRIVPGRLESDYGSSTREFIEKLVERAGTQIVVGHNVYFHDKKILEKYGLKFLSKVRYVDTLVIATIAIPEHRSRELEELARLFRYEYRAHDPVEDALATWRVLPHLLKILQVKGILNHVLELNYEPIGGLKDLLTITKIDVEHLPNLYNIPHKKDTQHKVEEEHDGPTVILDIGVTDEAEGNVWLPRILRKVSLEDYEQYKTDTYSALAFLIVYSYTYAGKKDTLLHLALLENDHNLRKAIDMIIDRYSEEYDPPRSGTFLVDYHYVEHLVSKAIRLGIRLRKVILRRFLPLVICRDSRTILRSVRELCKISDNIILQSSLKYFNVPTRLIDKASLEGLDGDPKVSLIKESSRASLRSVDLIASSLLTLLRQVHSSILIVTSSSLERDIVREVLSIVGSGHEVKLLSVDMLSVRDIYDISRTIFDVAIVVSMETLKSIVENVLEVGSEIASSLALSLIFDLSRPLSGRLYLLHLGRCAPPRRCEIHELGKLEQVSINVQPVPLFNDVEHALSFVEENIVSRYWGFRLRPYQRRSVLYLLHPYIRGYIIKRPLTVIVLPTGAGKSIIFQSTALALRTLSRGVTLVISPLLALIEDQVRSLKRRGIKVCRIDGTVDNLRKRRMIEEIKRGMYDVVYVTPEQFQNADVRKLLEECDINYLIFDEAHCVVKWGRTFRPAYMYVAELVRKLRERGVWLPVACFTATLPERILRELISLLGENDLQIRDLPLDLDVSQEDKVRPRDRPVVLKGPVIRENLIVDRPVVLSEKDDRIHILARVIRNYIRWIEENFGNEPWVGIVFTSFVRSRFTELNAEYVAKMLSRMLGEDVAVFHAQMPKKEKERILEKLYEVSQGRSRQPRIVVCTKAFGMGVDIPNIRWIVHYTLSDSVEDYYQEVGRGGRDMKQYRATLLYSREDIKIKLRQIKESGLRPRTAARLFNFMREIIFKAYTGRDTITIPSSLLYGVALSVEARETAKRVAKARERGYTSRLDFEKLIERVTVSTEKTLHLLSEMGLIQYDVNRAEVRLCLDHGDIEIGHTLSGRTVYTCSEQDTALTSARMFLLSRVTSIEELRNNAPRDYHESVIIPSYEDDRRIKTLLVLEPSKEKVSETLRNVLEKKSNIKLIPVRELDIGKVSKVFEIYVLDLSKMRYLSEKNIAYRAARLVMDDVTSLVVTDKLVRKLIYADDVTRTLREEVEKYFTLGQQQYSTSILNELYENLFNIYTGHEKLRQLIDSIRTDIENVYTIDLPTCIKIPQERTKMKQQIAETLALIALSLSLKSGIDLEDIYIIVPKGFKTEVINRLNSIMTRLDLPFEKPCQVIYVDTREPYKSMQELPEVGSVAIFLNMVRREISKRIIERLRKVFNTIIIINIRSR